MSKNFLTDYGTLCLNMIRTYPTVYEYYDEKAGTACIPIDVYRESKTLQEELYNLLKTPQFMNEKYGTYYNWAMEIATIMHPETEEMVDGICIRDVESY